jgi:diguanylate cyclase (GGDEF)-like protein
MRLRFWVGFSAVLLIAAGSVVAAAIVHSNDSASFHQMQRDEATRAAHQAEAVAALSVGELSGAAAFFQAEGDFNRHEFEVVGHSLLREGVLTSTGFVQRVPAGERASFERGHGIVILERGPDEHLRRSRPRPVYFPLTYVVARRGAQRAVGYDLGSDPERAPFLHRARDSGRPVATGVVPLVLGGNGLIVYRPVYRDGAPVATVAQRRRALLGYAAGSFRVHDLAASALATVPHEDAVQLRAGQKRVIGPREALEDPASATIQIANRTWLLIVRDPNRPDVSLPLLLAVVGIALAALLGALILIWSRNERMQELQREASQDSLTGLKNRRRFEEELRATMARGRREGTTGALLMLDLDYFKKVNDAHGHPAGDHLIEEIAAVLRRRTRASDILARLGGDEFAVVLPRCTVAEARTAADSITKAIREHESAHGDFGAVTASVGVAMFGDDPRTSFESIVSEADTAMYAAKDSGRDAVRVFDPVAVRDEAPETT